MKDILLYGGIAVTVVLTVAYFVVLYLYPEWIGISGKDSEETLRAHQDESSKD